MTAPPLAKYARTSLGSADEVLRQLVDTPESLPLEEQQDPQASAVLPARGEYDALAELLQLLRTDWRDALVAAGLEDDDWPAKLDVALGRPEKGR